MLIDIDKIKVGDRIRKDFGDIEELAEDISENGLINPPVVNKEYELLAGERRLRACKLLGWPQIEVRMMDTRDAEHDLEIEVSENECRKEFTKTERLDYARRLARIEAAKNQQGKRSDLAQDVVQSERNRAANAVATILGTNRETLRQEQYIEDHRDMVSLEDFAAWDEGKLSTNKTYQKIIAAQKLAEQQRNQAEQERDAAKRNLAEAYRTSELLETQVAALKRQVAEKPKPEVIEREVVREVVPSDYEAAKRRIRELEHLESIHSSDNKKLRESLNTTREELNRAKNILNINENVREVRRDVQYLITATNSYVRQYGGLTWTVQQLEEVDDSTLEQLRKSVRNLATFSSALMTCLESMND